VSALLERPDVELFSFRAAYSRKFPALTPLWLHEGLLDLGKNLPSEHKSLLAPAALLACRAELHPRVVEQILKVAQAIHAPGSLLDPPLRFSTREGIDLPLHEAAEVYLTQGECFVSRTLPYPLLRWASIFRFLLPFVLWFPLVRVLPEVAGWRVGRRLSPTLRRAAGGRAAPRDRRGRRRASSGPGGAGSSRPGGPAAL
jgi:hypothetical protein